MILILRKDLKCKNFLFPHCLPKLSFCIIIQYRCVIVQLDWIILAFGNSRILEFPLFFKLLLFNIVKLKNIFHILGGEPPCLKKRIKYENFNYSKKCFLTFRLFFATHLLGSSFCFAGRSLSIINLYLA